MRRSIWKVCAMPWGPVSCFHKSMQSGNGSAHTDRRVDGSQGLHGSQRITADISQHREIHLFQNIENTAVRAAGTHHGRSGRNDFIKRRSRLYVPAHTRVSHSQSVVETGERVLPAQKKYEKNPGKYIMMPANAKKRHPEVEARPPPPQAALQQPQTP